MNKKILFVSQKKAQCGIYEFGKSITDVLQHSNCYQFIRIECSSLDELHHAIKEYEPAAIIYNYYPLVMPWVASRLRFNLYKSHLAFMQIPQIGIIHEMTQHMADAATNYKNRFLWRDVPGLNNCLFDYYIVPDPTLLLKNPIVYKTGRLIPSYQNINPIPSKPTIGSFGFGIPNKGFEKIVELVEREFDEAIVRFNIPASDFCDQDGSLARDIAEKCRARIARPGIQLKITHDFMDHEAMLDFLSENTINVFLYDKINSKGISSAVDHAMAVQRPIAVSDNPMFRHLLNIEPSICVNNNSLKTIIRNGFAPLQKYYHEWNAENLLWEYERILNSVFEKEKSSSKPILGIFRKLKSKWNKFFLKPDSTFTWLNDSQQTTEDDMSVDYSVRYQPIEIPPDASLNRILDNDARELYKPAIEKLTELLPKTMSKKIAEANVQQGFVLDTVCRYICRYQNPKVLCVGCYEDTASMGLIKMGYNVEEIDPVKDYYLQEYFTKPTTIKNSYDIIFSTSVIEHDPNDESFIKCIAGLLADGGVAIITCDYKDGWKAGEPKPECDARFYTQKDLKERLLPQMLDCYLVDEPQWDCPNPDFNLGEYQYTFAALVVKKSMKAAK